MEKTYTITYWDKAENTRKGPHYGWALDNLSEEQAATIKDYLIKNNYMVMAK